MGTCVTLLSLILTTEAQRVVSFDNRVEFPRFSGHRVRHSQKKMISAVQNLFNDNRKIGVILVSLGMTLLVLGVVLLFDPVLLAMGNILFLGSDVG